jgi:O-antigen/teichoic acid export membrane protein
MFHKEKESLDPIAADRTASLKEKAVKSVFWLGGAKLVGQAITWVLTLLLVRILTPEDFGLVGLAAAYQAFVIIIYDLNLGSALVQTPELRKDDPSTCFWFIIGLSILLYCMTWMVSPFLSVFFNNPKVVQIVRVFAVGTLIDSLQIVPFWLLSRNLDFDKRAKAEFSSNLIYAVLQISLAFAGYGVWSLVFGYISKYAVLCVLTYHFSQWRPELTFHYSRLRQLLRFSLPLTGAKILRLVSARTDVIVIGRFFNTTVLGNYNVAMDLSRIPHDKIMTIVTQIAYPTFSRHSESLRELRHYFLKLNYLLVLFLLPLYVGGYLIAEDLIVVLLTDKWLAATLPFQVFCILGMFQSLNHYSFMILNARGKSVMNLVLSALSAVVLPSGFLIGSRSGIQGICYSWLVTYPLLFCLTLHITLKDIGLSLFTYLRSLLHPLVGTAVMGMMVLIIRHQITQPNIRSTLITMLIGSMSYAFYLFMFSKDSFRLVKDIFETAGLLQNLRAFRRLFNHNAN